MGTYSRSKQNSDASGMFYQWGRKDPFIFPTSSIHNGGGTYAYGKYLVKIYNNKSELIYQKDDGGDNLGKTPKGGLIYPDDDANSMMMTIQTPNMLYRSIIGGVINQIGHSKELWSYYWTSYSRGKDGDRYNDPWHNTYLDGYIALRSKSIYDPCPYGYRTSSNGTYNNLNLKPDWLAYNYGGGAVFSNTWYPALATRAERFIYAGQYGFKYSATLASNIQVYFFDISISVPNRIVGLHHNQSVRCIEDDKELKK